ncbi:hypothetical protein V6N13_074444 [Hibiscus sabdariffa]
MLGVGETIPSLYLGNLIFKRRGPPCAWTDLYCPSSHRGLSIRQVHLQSDVFLMKVAFRLIAQPHALWVRFLRAKYKCHERVPGSIRSRNCSSLWSGVAAIWKEVCSHICWHAGNGRSTDFWWDQWVLDVGSLYHHVQLPHLIPLQGVRIAVMVVKDGERR